MNKRLIIILISLLFIMCNNNSTNSDKDNVEIEREYNKNIVRVYANNIEKEILLKSESIYPDRDSVLAAIYSINYINIPDSNYWYYSSFDGILIPYTITKEAIEYYSHIIDTMQVTPSEIFITADFSYYAEINYYELYEFQGNDPYSGNPIKSETYNNVYVVEMQLNWGHYCGPLCGLWIDKKREIIFDNDGNLVKIYYDGQIPVIVS